MGFCNGNVKPCPTVGHSGNRKKDPTVVDEGPGLTWVLGSGFYRKPYSTVHLNKVTLFTIELYIDH